MFTDDGVTVVVSESTDEPANWNRMDRYDDKTNVMDKTRSTFVSWALLSPGRLLLCSKLQFQELGWIN